MKRDPASSPLSDTGPDPSARKAHGDLVSIIIPTFDYARFLPEAVDSALAQSHQPVEIVIVDDGSSDETRQVVEQRYAAEPRVRYVWQENAGLSAARNTGIAAARGDWLVFLDADDRLLPRMVERARAAFEDSPGDLGLVACLALLIDAAGHRIPDRIHFPQAAREITTLDLLVMNRFGCTVLAQRRVFERCGGFDTALPASEDRDMWIRVSRQFRILRLGETLFEVRRHGANMSGAGTRQADSIARVLAKARTHEALVGCRRVFWLKVFSHFLFQRALLESDAKPILALSRIAGSILLWPWFPDRRELGQERAGFRLRSMAWILRRRWRESSH